MRTFTLTIEIGNDAVQTGEDLHGLVSTAAAQIREYSADELQSGTPFRRLHDINGNTIGKWEVK